MVMYFKTWMFLGCFVCIMFHPTGSDLSCITCHANRQSWGQHNCWLGHGISLKCGSANKCRTVLLKKGREPDMYIHRGCAIKKTLEQFPARFCQSLAPATGITVCTEWCATSDCNNTPKAEVPTTNAQG